MISYTVRVVQKHNSKVLVAEIENKKYSTLAKFLTRIVPVYSKEILVCIDDVLSGKEQEATWEGGDVFLIAQNKRCYLERFSESEEDVPCDVSTKELKRLILAWLEEIKNEENRK